MPYLLLLLIGLLKHARWLVNYSLWVALARYGLLWVAMGGYGSLWVIPVFSTTGRQYMISQIFTTDRPTDRPNFSG